MSVVEDVTESNPPDRGLARRDFIRKAAVAGAIGWTAPLVLQSLTSPASAASANCHFYVFKVTKSNAGNGNPACSNVIISPATCPTTAAPSVSCPSYTRGLTTAAPVNFSAFACVGTSGPPETELVTFTITTPGCTFAGKLAGSVNAACPGSVSLGTVGGTTTTLGPTTVTTKDDFWYAYLAVQC